MLESGAIGIGLRNELIVDLLTTTNKTHLDFLELAPENWMGMGGIKAQQLEQMAQRFPLIAHGLSLSIGDTQPLNIDLIKRIKQFLSDYRIEIYSEHLSFGRDKKGYLYDLLPVPFYEENIDYLSQRILQAQEWLGRKIAFENISYYHQHPNNIPEIEFITALLKKSDCDLLLDVNNVYVNSQNHHYDPYAFISALPPERVRYFHVAGHYRLNHELILDTHGRPISDPVIDLLKHAYQHIGLRPTLLERDHHVPSLDELRTELSQIYQAQPQQVPMNVQTALDAFSTSIRQKQHAQPSIRLYRELLSGTINEIIASAYPRFFKTITPELQLSLLDTFIETHPCTVPEHAQLPTEFLLFLQTTSMPELLKKIAECEWAELNMELSANADTQLFSLPFDYDLLSDTYVPLPEQEIYYRAIYRNDRHEVYHIAITAYRAREIQLSQQNSHPKPELPQATILDHFTDT